MGSQAEMLWIQQECQNAQYRPLNVIDLEHVLCKISRQISATLKEKTERKAKGKGKAKVEEVEEVEMDGEQQYFEQGVEENAGGFSNAEEDDGQDYEDYKEVEEEYEEVEN